MAVSSSRNTAGTRQGRVRSGGCGPPRQELPGIASRFSEHRVSKTHEPNQAVPSPHCPTSRRSFGTCGTTTVRPHRRVARGTGVQLDCPAGDLTAPRHRGDNRAAEYGNSRRAGAHRRGVSGRRASLRRLRSAAPSPPVRRSRTAPCREPHTPPGHMRCRFTNCLPVGNKCAIPFRVSGSKVVTAAFTSAARHGIQPINRTSKASHRASGGVGRSTATEVGHDGR